MRPIAEARGFSSSGCADQDVSLGRSSHTVNACLVQICQGQNRLGGVTHNYTLGSSAIKKTSSSPYLPTAKAGGFTGGIR